MNFEERAARRLIRWMAVGLLPLFGVGGAIPAEVRLPSVFGHHMVLQQGQQNRVWGSWAELREAQTLALSKLPNTGQAVIVDLGEGKDIHPTNKEDLPNVWLGSPWRAATTSILPIRARPSSRCKDLVVGSY